jgi:hypothetical protein
MKRPLSILSATTLVAGAVVASGAQGQELTDFATFTKLASGSNVMWANSDAGGANGGTGAAFYTISSPAATSAGATLVSFGFLYGGLPTGIRAMFSLNGSVDTGNPALRLGSSLVQNNVHGSFSFTANCGCLAGFQDFPGFTIFDGDNLLSSIDYAGASIGGLVAARSAGFAVSQPGAPGQTLDFRSDFIDFTDLTVRSFSMTLDAINIPFDANAGAALRTFKAASVGTFSAGIAPVPEPYTYMLMLAGLVAVGSIARHRTT